MTTLMVLPNMIWLLRGVDGTAAANPIKLFAPWGPGYKWDTLDGFYFNPPSHNGIDFNGVYDLNGTYIRDDTGEPVMAAEDGVVEVAQDENDGYGIKVDIHHGGSVYTRYAHIQENSLTVSPGIRVLHGQMIGRNGCTGSPCSAPHIHFEVRTGGRWGTPELPTPFDGTNMADDQKFLSHNFVERLEIGYRDADFTADGWPDIGAYEPHIGRWWVAKNGTNTNHSFISQGIWADGWGADAIPGDWRHLTGEFGTPAGTDIAIYQKRAGQWWVANRRQAHAQPAQSGFFAPWDPGYKWGTVAAGCARSRDKECLDLAADKKCEIKSRFAY